MARVVYMHAYTSEACRCVCPEMKIPALPYKGYDPSDFLQALECTNLALNIFFRSSWAVGVLRATAYSLRIGVRVFVFTPKLVCSLPSYALKLKKTHSLLSPTKQNSGEAHFEYPARPYLRFRHAVGDADIEPI